MPFRKEIDRAYISLLAHQNADGGICATKAGDISGCWTTASTLEACINTRGFASRGFLEIKRMVEFLLDTQLQESVLVNQPYSNSESELSSTPQDAGGWPVLSGGRGSTLATGHAIGALNVAKPFFDVFTPLQERVEAAISLGNAWISNWQNNDGGWGPEPVAGSDGLESRISATYYALYGLWYLGGSFNNSAIVRRGVNYLKNSQNVDGSWGFVKGVNGDISSTARALTSLLRSEHVGRDDPIVKSGIKYILSNQLPGDSLWDLGHEGYLVEDAPGETMYNNNSVFDVLICLLTADISSDEVYKTLKWYLQSQEDNGLCCLSSPMRRRKNIYTWPTAEWITGVSMASRVYARKLIEEYELPVYRRHKAAIGILVLAVFTLAVLHFELGSSITTWWQNLPEKTRDLVTFGVILAVMVNIAAAFTYDKLKAFFQKSKLRFVNWVYKNRKAQNN